ncbi:uncharacterized protein [Onthophagus taurus]|uniref:uncharacterized protein n=1 Tax=Onthophagus taurus TaxID=166361 RepID=UPI0039BDE49D
MPPKNTDDWLQIANNFYKRTNFPNCIGAIDGKHIRIKKPASSGSEFFNYKCFFSTVLLGVADSDYCFTSIEVGAYGSASDSNIFKKSKFGSLLEKGQLNIPGPTLLPNEETGTVMPFIILGDEAFATSEHILRPYPSKNLSVTKRVFNYRLSRARRMVECSFGILAGKWRILNRPLDTSLELSDIIIKACCILHNFVRKHDGVCFEDSLYECHLDNMNPVGTRGIVISL